ncbi:unnamed protein product [Urochloa humidicola]
MLPLPFLFHLPALIYPALLLPPPILLIRPRRYTQRKQTWLQWRRTTFSPATRWTVVPAVRATRGATPRPGDGTGPLAWPPDPRGWGAVGGGALRTELSQLIRIGAGGPRWGATLTVAAVDVIHSGRRRGRQHRGSAKGPCCPPPTTRSRFGRRHGRHRRGFAQAAAAKGLLRDSTTGGASREPTRVIRPLLQVDAAHVLRKKSNRVEHIHDHLTPSMP